VTNNKFNAIRRLDAIIETIDEHEEEKDSFGET
jgi:hypothetical protein